MNYKNICWDRSKVKYYFDYNGQRFGQGTEILFTDDFYRRHAGKCYISYCNPRPSIFGFVNCEGKNPVWYLGNCIVDDLVLENDIKEIVKPVPYVVVTDKDRIRAKKEKGQTWEYIWPGTIVYIFCMIFITVFNERVWGWIAATILYNNYCYEQLSR